MSREYCKIAPHHPVHAHYHAKEYGFPTTNERRLFERLCLEIMQAGLSWEIVLKKRKAFNRAFDNFSVAKVAHYQKRDIDRLLRDPDIIRNRLKIEAIIANAKIILSMRKSDGGFHRWLCSHHPLKKDAWVRLFKKTFKFTGGEITNEFLMSLGYLPGAHWQGCEIFHKISALKSAAKPLPRPGRVQI
jgi:DNA-3-methyladenine glycosylase I